MVRIMVSNSNQNSSSSPILRGPVCTGLYAEAYAIDRDNEGLLEASQVARPHAKALTSQLLKPEKGARPLRRQNKHMAVRGEGNGLRLNPFIR